MGAYTARLLGNRRLEVNSPRLIRVETKRRVVAESGSPAGRKRRFVSPLHDAEKLLRRVSDRDEIRPVGPHGVDVNDARV